MPALAESEVQTRLSAILNPAPFQLQGVTAHTTETRLFGPVRLAVILKPDADFTLKLKPRIVASAPNCDQPSESVEF